jgi:hypothetical protein
MLSGSDGYHSGELENLIPERANVLHFLVKGNSMAHDTGYAGMRCKKLTLFPTRASGCLHS